jgi:hypothetical protein
MTPTFDVGKALTFGLDVFTARPMAFVTLAVWTVLYGAVLGVIQLQSIGPELATISQLNMSTEPSDPTAALAAMGQYFWLALPFFAVATILGLIAEAAWLRLFVRGQDVGIFPFRLGKDEIIYMISSLLVGLSLLAGLMLAFVAIIVISLVLAALGPAGIAIGSVVGFIVIMGVMIVGLTIATPVMALSLLRGRIAIIETASGVRKIFWPLLGSLIVAVVGYMLFYALLTGVLGAMPFDQFGILPDGEVAHWATLFPYFVIVQAIAIIPIALLRGVACYAALQIDEADATPTTP